MFRKSEDDQRKKMYTPSGDRVPGYTASEIESIKVALGRKLGPEFISKRKGPGFNSVQYLEGWKAINLANEIFGFNGWNTELKEYKVDFIDDKNGAISMGLSCIVRVVLKDGTFHEDVGYGSIDNCRSKSMAFEKCKKEACTDGMKRALRQFGNALGNCLYDKEFLQQITKVTMEPNQFDEHALMRRSVTVPKIEHTNNHLNTPKAIEGTNQSAITVPVVRNEIQQSKPDLKMNQMNAEKRELVRRSPSPMRVNKAIIKTANHNNDEDDFEDDFEDSYMFSDDLPADLEKEDNRKDGLPSSDFEDDVDIDGANFDNPNTGVSKTTTVNAFESDISANSTVIPEHVTFVSATSADTIQQDPTLQASLKFDVSYTSANISRSSLINHSKSLPVKKSILTNSNGKDVPAISVANTNLEKSKNLSTVKPKLGPIFKSSSTPTNPSKSNHMVNMQTSATSGSAINPLGAKRSFGLPPDKLQSKRLRK